MVAFYIIIHFYNLLLLQPVVMVPVAYLDGRVSLEGRALVGCLVNLGLTGAVVSPGNLARGESQENRVWTVFREWTVSMVSLEPRLT